MKTTCILSILTAITFCTNAEFIKDETSPKNLIQLTKEASKANNICPDYVHQCSGTDPCCRTPVGTYTCCPYPYGSCCSDGLHCCPYGMVCYGNTTCVKANKDMSFTKLKTLSAHKLKDVICKDGEQCDDDNTCCQLQDGSYGCCPLPNAVCCSDKIHCCPQGSVCDTSEGLCISGTVRLPFL